MSGSEELLGDPIAPGMHRRRANIALWIQGILIVVVAIASIFISGGRTSPLYLPLGWFFVILLSGGILLAAESFIFKSREMKYAESNSKRYMMAKYAMRDAGWLAVLALVIGIILILPPVKGVLNDLSSQNKSDSIYGYKCVNFPSMDWLGLSEVFDVWVAPLEGAADVWILHRSDGDKYCIDHLGDQILTLAVGKGHPTVNDPYHYPLVTSTLEEMTIVMHPISTKEVVVDYGLKVRVFDIVLPTLGALVLVYGLINGGFAAIMYGSKKRYVEGSIYRE